MMMQNGQLANKVTELGNNLKATRSVQMEDILQFLNQEEPEITEKQRIALAAAIIKVFDPNFKLKQNIEQQTPEVQQQGTEQQETEQ